METSHKLASYLKRNYWLIKKHFTPRSLVTLSLKLLLQVEDSFGMNCFLDKVDIFDTVESYFIKYVKSILGLKNCVNSDKVRLTLGKPKVQYGLWLLLRKNVRKYERHFGDKTRLNIVMGKYEGWLGCEDMLRSS